MRAAALFDDLIRPQQQRRRDREAESLGGLAVDHELEFRGVLDGKVCWTGAFEDLVDVGGRATKQFPTVGSVRHESPGFHKLSESVDGRELAHPREVHDLGSVIKRQIILHRDESIDLAQDYGVEGALETLRSP